MLYVRFAVGTYASERGDSGLPNSDAWKRPILFGRCKDSEYYRKRFSFTYQIVKKKCRIYKIQHYFDTESKRIILFIQFLQNRLQRPLLPQVAWFSPSLLFELCREIVGRLKVESVRYLFYAHACRGEQFFCPLYSQVLLVCCRRQSCVLLE